MTRSEIKSPAGVKREIEITRDGVISVPWWSPEIGDILCAMCAKCPGWRSDKKLITCENGNPWCG